MKWEKMLPSCNMPVSMCKMFVKSAYGIQLETCVVCTAVGVQFDVRTHLL